MEDGGEEVVATVGDRVWSGLEVILGIVEAEFGAFPGGGVDEPAGAVSVIVNQDGSCDRAALAVKASDLGLCYLAYGEILDLKCEIQWAVST